MSDETREIIVVLSIIGYVFCMAPWVTNAYDEVSDFRDMLRRRGLTSRELREARLWLIMLALTPVWILPVSAWALVAGWRGMRKAIQLWFGRAGESAKDERGEDE